MHLVLLTVIVYDIVQSIVWVTYVPTDTIEVRFNTG